MRGYTSVALVLMLSSFAAGLTLPFWWKTQPVHSVEPITPDQRVPIDPPESPGPSDDYKWPDDGYEKQHPIDDDSGVVMGMDPSIYAQLPAKIRAISSQIKHGHAGSRAYVKRAWLNISLGEFQQAVRDATKAIHKNRKDNAAYAARGYAYFQLGKQAQADRDTAKAEGL